MKKAGTFLAVILVFVFLFNLPACQEEKKVVDLTNAYVGVESCKSCHEKAYDDWQYSHHDWSMKFASNETVLGDFNNVGFVEDGVSYTFRKEADLYLVDVHDIDGSDNTYEVEYTFGVVPLQQYLIKFPDGKYQTLRATWDSKKKIWFHQYAGDVIDVNDWLHWTQGGQRWNTMCAECHSTNLKKNYDVQNDVFATTYDEINVGCESCHGPGKLHVAWAENGEIGPSLVLNSGLDQISQINACAPCHARRVKLTETFSAEVDFNDQFLLQNVNDDYYHGDGQILEEDYVMGSFFQSKMFQKGVKCSDCHFSHSLTLRWEGNMLCMQCHEPKYNTEQHHFHIENTEGAMCVDCHMTGKVYMGNDFRRDHSFRIPRPDQSVSHGTPNACISCHEDKSNKWAADWVVKWYGPERPLNYTDQLLVASNEVVSDEEYNELIQFLKRKDQLSLARSTVLEYFSFSGSVQEIKTLVECLNDSSPLVRYNAIRKFNDLPRDQRMPVAMKHVRDERKLVRIGAADLIIEVNIEDVKVGDRAYVRKAREEHKAMLMANADFPLGRLQLGDYYLRIGQINRAIIEYEMAIKMDHLLTPVYSNLATAYNLTNNNEKSLATLNRLIEIEPEYGRAYYLRALLKHEIGEVEEAISDLEMAIKFESDNFRYYYNLSNMYLYSGELELAKRNIETGLKLEPNSREGLELQAMIEVNLSRLSN